MVEEFIDLTESKPEHVLRNERINRRQQELRQRAIETISKAKNWRGLKIACPKCLHDAIEYGLCDFDEPAESFMTAECVGVEPIIDTKRESTDKAGQNKVQIIRAYDFLFECHVSPTSTHKTCIMMFDTELQPEMRELLANLHIRTR